MTIVSTTPPSDYDLIESVVNQLPAKAQEDARALFQSFSSGVQQTKSALGLPSSSSQQNVAAPPAATLAVSGGNGAFNLGITNPSQANPTPLWHEISYSPVASFASGVTTLPTTQATSLTVNAVGQTLYFRIRSSANQVVWNNYAVYGSPVSSGLVSSKATSDAGAFNQTNFGTVTSAAVGSSAEVSIQGAGGALTSLVAQKGPAQSVLPSSTVLGAAPGSDLYVGYKGGGYLLRPTLAAVLADDTITPIGKVSVVETGAPVLPTVVPIVAAGGVVGYNVTDQGNGITGPLTLTVVDPGGPGTGATTGAQTIESGKLISVAPGNAGSGYDGSTAVTVAGGIGPGTPGGGTALGTNGGRMTNV
jgi:hypothetical protein